MSPRSWQTSKLLELEIHPLELHFPFERNKLIECPVTLTNRTDHHIGVRITLTSSYAHHNYFHSSTSPATFEMVDPHSTLVVVVALRELLVPPSQDRSEFEVLLVAMGSEQHLKNLELEPSSNFVRRVEELGGQVHRRMLTAIICAPTSRQAAVTYQVSKT
jgi:coatomer subunit beta'